MYLKLIRCVFVCCLIWKHFNCSCLCFLQLYVWTGPSISTCSHQTETATEKRLMCIWTYVTMTTSERENERGRGDRFSELKKLLWFGEGLSNKGLSAVACFIKCCTCDLLYVLWSSVNTDTVFYEPIALQAACLMINTSNVLYS